MRIIQILVIALLYSSFSYAEEECIPKSQIQSVLNSGVFDSIFKYRVILEEQINHLSLISLVRSSLDSNNEEQLLFINLIDKTTNTQLNEIALAVSMRENEELFLSNKKAILALISTIKVSRSNSQSKVSVDETPLVNLESLFSK